MMARAALLPLSDCEAEHLDVHATPSNRRSRSLCGGESLLPLEASVVHDIRLCTGTDTTPSPRAGRNHDPRSNPRPSMSLQHPIGRGGGIKCSKLYVGFIPTSATKKQLLERFRQFGTVRDCIVILPKMGMSFTYGFVEFEERSSAIAAMQVLHDTQWGKFHINVQWESASSPGRSPSLNQAPIGIRASLYSVCVQQLPLTTTEEQLRTLFSKVGTVKSVHILKPKPKSETLCGFVQLPTLEGARCAMRALNNKRFGPYTIKVELTHATALQCKSSNAANRGEVLEKMKGFQMTSVPAQGSQGVAQDGEMSRGYKLAGLAKSTIPESVISVFGKMNSPCPPCTTLPQPTLVPQTLCLPHLADIDSGFHSQLTTSGDSNTASAHSTPVRRPAEERKATTIQDVPPLEDSTSSSTAFNPHNSQQCSVLEDTTSSSVHPQNQFESRSNTRDLNLPPSALTTDPPPLSSELPLPEHSTMQVTNTMGQDAHSRKFPPLKAPSVSLQSHGAGRGHALLSLLECASRKQEKPEMSTMTTTGVGKVSQGSKAGVGRGHILNCLLQHMSSESSPGLQRGFSLESTSQRSIPTSEVTPEPLLEAHSETNTLLVETPPSLVNKEPEKLTEPVKPVPRSKRERSVTIAAVFPGAMTSSCQNHTSAEAAKHNPLSMTTALERRLPEIESVQKGPIDVTSSLSNSSTPSSLPPSQSSFLAQEESSDATVIKKVECSQALSSGDELEFVEVRYGRRSEELEQKIHLHQRNIHRWQVELRRLQQKNAVMADELNREVRDMDVDPLGDISPERMQAFDYVIELHSRFVSETEKVKRREIERELILMKGQEKYLHDKLALLELKLELEASDAHENLTLAKLENRTLQAKAELFS